MKMRMMHVISSVLVLSLVGQMQAQDATWTDATEDHLWSTPDNWSDFPTEAHWAKVRNGLPGPTIDFEGAVARRVHVGYGEGGALTVDGGTLLIAPDDLLLGKNGGSGTLNMISGSIEIARDFEVAGGNPGIVNMTGGSITVADDFEIPETEGNADSPAVVNLNGGTIRIGGDLHMFEHGLLDITAGTLILDGNAVSVVQGFIDAGLITPYDANGTVVLDYDPDEDQTTVKAIHKLNPAPADGGLAAPGTVALEWTVDADTLVDVWFGDNPDWTTWEQLVERKAVSSVSVTVAAKQRYYWAVDTYESGAEDPNIGPIFSFLSDNAAPDVDAGDDVMTWLDNGSVEEPLSGTVVDTDATTTTWSVVSEPDDPNSPKAVIADPAALETTITLYTPGEYVLELAADDGEYVGTDVITITVYGDSCEAAKAQPDFEPIPGDINEDCIVDELDQAIMMENWLKCNGLDCPDPEAP